MQQDKVESMLQYFAPVIERYLQAIARDRNERVAIRMRQRLANEPEAIVSESLIWQMLVSANLKPICEPELEDRHRPDFLVHSALFGDLYIEVCVIQSDAMHARTGFAPLEICLFELDEPKISKIVGQKASQLISASKPTVLFMTCHSMGAGHIFGEVAAVQMLTGRQSIVFPASFDQACVLSQGRILDSLNLKYSIFLRRSQSGAIEVFRKSISAVVLVDFDARRAKLW